MMGRSTHFSLLREKTVGASLCIRAVRKVASELRRRKYQVVIDGIPRYGIMSAQNFCEFRWYHGIFRPEAVVGFGAFFYAPDAEFMKGMVKK